MAVATVSDVRVALEKQGVEFRVALEKQGVEFRVALEKQGRELASAIERQTAIIERRLAIVAYWLFGVMVAGHAATISVVIALVD